MKDYIETNKALWNARTEVHFDSSFYDNEGFLETLDSLTEIEKDLLGDIKGKRIIHLQCHFGQDSISLAQMGASVTALDFSDNAIKRAIELNKRAGTDVEFILGDVFKARELCKGDFDLVFTSFGVLGWLPDMDAWAGVVKSLLKPDGKLVLAEFHPVVWMFSDDFTHVQYPYSSPEGFREQLEGTYTDQNAPITLESVFWNHGLANVMQALLKKSMVINDFQEYNYSPHNSFQPTVQTGHRRFMIKGMEEKLPMVYSIIAENTNNS